MNENTWNSGPGAPMARSGPEFCAGSKIPNGGMATQLVAKKYDLGSLGVPGPASTPGWGTDLQGTLKRPGKIYHWNLTVCERADVGQGFEFMLHPSH